MNKIKKGEMDLSKTSQDIISLFRGVSKTKELGASDLSLEREITKIINKDVVNVLEPENVYEKDKYYEGLGYYIGIIDTHPWGADYFKRQHHFRIPREGRGIPSEINQVLIREIKK